MEALYFRVSIDRQTTENQFEDLLQIAERDGSGRDWQLIRRQLAKVVAEENRPTEQESIRTVYRVNPGIAEQLAELCLYVEQGRSSKVGSRARPMFQRMRRDAAARKSSRLLVWKVSRLGRNMREVIQTVHEFADIGIDVFPVKSQTGPITSSMGRLLWAIQAWFAEMENDERSEAVKAGQRRAREKGARVGRPKRVFDRAALVELRRQGMSWRQVARELGIGMTTVRRSYRLTAGPELEARNSAQGAGTGNGVRQADQSPP